MRRRRRGPTSSRLRPSLFEVRRQEVRDAVLDFVRVAARLAVQRPLEDLVLLQSDLQLEIALAHRATQNLHEVPLHRCRRIAGFSDKGSRLDKGFISYAVFCLKKNKRMPDQPIADV